MFSSATLNGSRQNASKPLLAQMSLESFAMSPRLFSLYCSSIKLIKKCQISTTSTRRLFSFVGAFMLFQCFQAKLSMSSAHSIYMQRFQLMSLPFLFMPFSQPMPLVSSFRLCWRFSMWVVFSFAFINFPIFKIYEL